MKAIRVPAYGQPPPVDDVPEPQATGPDDVVVRIGGAGLCRTDLHITDGWFADVIPAELPVVLGHENAGWVYAAGPAVEHLAVGDPVICHPNFTCGVCPACRTGDTMRCVRGPNLLSSSKKGQLTGRPRGLSSRVEATTASWGVPSVPPASPGIHLIKPTFTGSAAGRAAQRRRLAGGAAAFGRCPRQPAPRQGRRSGCRGRAA